MWNIKNNVLVNYASAAYAVCMYDINENVDKGIVVNIIQHNIDKAT